MNTITITTTATRDERDAFIQQATSRIQRALRKMERIKEQPAQRSTGSPAISEKG
jgi:hypothetical protein